MAGSENIRTLQSVHLVQQHPAAEVGHAQDIRLLAAVMFVDIVGYTASMHTDEEGAKRLRDRQRQVLEKAMAEYGGMIVQYYGDGALSIFRSACQAVKCAVSLQLRFRQKPRVPVRIGIHLGDVGYNDEGVFGDAVNVAARIESLSVSGGVLISGQVFDEIRNHTVLKAVSFGKYVLKNVAKAIHIFAISSQGLTVPELEEIRRKAGCCRKKIAVLPFVHVGSGPDDEYFADGLTEGLINALTCIGAISVAARTSAHLFKNKMLDIRKIGRKLNVDYLLEGSVRKVGQDIRITAQLIKASDGFNVWSHVFDRSCGDIFKMQDEVSIEIVSLLTKSINVEFPGRPKLQALSSKYSVFSNVLSNHCFETKSAI